MLSRAFTNGGIWDEPRRQMALLSSTLRRDHNFVLNLIMVYIYIFALFHSILLVLNDPFEISSATRAIQLCWIPAGFSQQRH